MARVASAAAEVVDMILDVLFLRMLRESAAVEEAEDGLNSPAPLIGVVPKPSGHTQLLVPDGDQKGVQVATSRRPSQDRSDTGLTKLV